MVENTPRFKFRLTPKNALYIFGANTIIAVFLAAIRFGSGFAGNLVYSQCIGFSISASLHVAIGRIKSTNVLVQVFVIAAVMIAATAVGMIIAPLIGSAFLAGPAPQALTADEKLAITLQSLLYSILFGSIITYVFISNERISEERLRRLDQEKNAVEAQLRLLQSQMEPHFLFNTLSNTISLIDSDPKTARRMLETFTAFLRSSFPDARERTVALSRELDLVRRYLDIFAIRMGDRLRYRIDVPDDILAVRIPPLLLQPLVENAIKHGLEPSAGGGELVIEGRRDGDTVRLLVADSGTGISEKAVGNGIGLANIRQRLDLLYGPRGRLVLEENTPSGVKATIEVPYETDTSNHSR